MPSFRGFVSNLNGLLVSNWILGGVVSIRLWNSIRAPWNLTILISLLTPTGIDTNLNVRVPQARMTCIWIHGLRPQQNIRKLTIYHATTSAKRGGILSPFLRLTNFFVKSERPWSLGCMSLKPVIEAHPGGDLLFSPCSPSWKRDVSQTIRQIIAVIVAETAHPRLLAFGWPGSVRMLAKTTSFEHWLYLSMQYWKPLPTDFRFILSCTFANDTRIFELYIGQRGFHMSSLCS